MLFDINNISKRRSFLLLLLIGALATVLYWRMLDNFFFSDDFEWLDQVKILELRSLSIFNPVVHPPSPYAQLTPLPPDYFTPLIHIIFWINYKLFGLNPFGYHLINLILHIINSYLVVYFVFLLGNNLTLATLVGLFFATSFSITNAVVWPSAYVDTVMFSFYILSLIAFLSFLRKGKHYHYVSSILLFILSLASKGTALTLPLALFFIEKYHSKSKIPIKHLSKYIPFASIILGYLVLLLDNSPISVSGQIDFSRIILNAVKVPMTLLIPEGLLPVNPALLLLSVLLFSAFVIILIKGSSSGLGRLGVLLMLIGVFPLFIIHWNFLANPLPLTDSISHRLYLGNLGFAMFIGGIILIMR
ncbi:MAG: glycosyltransferase family 39 protein [Deltaproteobacteria bacterium]|nr:glycosyltransferase family 39 protein [Deltaproteobacteria bacterium]